MIINNKDDSDSSIVGVKDGSVTTAVWTEKQYIDQKMTIKGSEHIIFIGNSKIIQEETYGIQPVFNKYGMMYSCLGSKGRLFVEKPVKRKEYNEFLAFAKKYQDSVKNVLESRAESFAKDAAAIGTGVGLDAAGTAAAISYISGGPAILGLLGGTLFLPIGGLAAIIFAGSKVVRNTTAFKKLMEQEYSCLILYFYMEQIRKFLGQED